jgi:hypothetical protein
MPSLAENVFLKTGILSQWARKVTFSDRISSEPIDKETLILIYCAPHAPEQERAFLFNR